MNSLAPFCRFSVVASCLFISAMLLVSGCAPDANAEIISPDLGPKLVIARSAGDVEIVPTAVPPKLAELTPDLVYANLPDDVRQAVEGADTGAASTIALKYACVGCHAIDVNEVKTGPTWHNMGDTAVVRVPGESPAQYLYTSIIDPTAHLVEGYPPNVMPQTFATTMTPEELATMVAYLLQQNGQ
jgi:mono/diheme cytochrome c family protein